MPSRTLILQPIKILKQSDFPLFGLCCRENIKNQVGKSSELTVFLSRQATACVCECNTQTKRQGDSRLAFIPKLVNKYVFRY